MAKPSIDQINYLNIVLMMFAGGLALVAPFYLFLVSYAILGPLHYLTEISWLHDRGYFMKGRRDAVPLVISALVVTGIMLNPSWNAGGLWIGALVFLTFAIAAIFAFEHNLRLRIGLLGIALAFMGFLLGNPAILLFLGVLVPTIIHVFVFTGVFILAGNLKCRRLSGNLAIMTFVGVAVALLLWHPLFLDSGTVTQYELKAYSSTGQNGQLPALLTLNYVLSDLLAPTPETSGSGVGQFIDNVQAFLFHDRSARAIMAFVAYAYCYHYLNWFSKTSLIGWHKISKKRLYTSLAIWIFSLVLYAIDYGIGLRWLFFLSFLHVLLEFPLNHVTMAGIFRHFMHGPKQMQDARGA